MFPAHQGNPGSGSCLLGEGLIVNSLGKGTGAINHVSLASKARSHVHITTHSLPHLFFGGGRGTGRQAGRQGVSFGLWDICSALDNRGLHQLQVLSHTWAAQVGREEQLLGRKGFPRCSCSAGGLIWGA